jgi:hypothetical protein
VPTPEAEAQLLKGVGHDEYHADSLPGAPHLSRSIAVKLLSSSPLHAWQAHPKLGGAPAEEPAEEPAVQARLDAGSLIHHLLLGAGQQIVAVEAPDWRTNAAKDARDEARGNGLLPVLRHKYEAALVTTSAIRASLRRYGVELAAYEPEVTALWQSNGVACKARLDALLLAGGEVLDVKVQDRISLRSFEAGIPAYGLHIQAASYLEALETAYPEIAGRTRFRFLLCERWPPCDVALVELAPAYLDLGAQQWKRARGIWARCLESDAWPGFGEREPIEPKPWQLEDEFTKVLQAAGEPAWAKGV